MTSEYINSWRQGDPVQAGTIVGRGNPDADPFELECWDVVVEAVASFLPGWPLAGSLAEDESIEQLRRAVFRRLPDSRHGPVAAVVISACRAGSIAGVLSTIPDGRRYMARKPGMSGCAGRSSPSMSTNTTWDDVGALARAVAELTGPANLSHDLLLELAGPIVDRMAAAVAELRHDPHGDSDGKTMPEPGAKRPRVGSSEAWSISTGEQLLRQAAVAAHEELQERGRRLAAWSGGETEQPLPDDPERMLSLVAALDAGVFSWTISAPYELICGRTGRALTRTTLGWWKIGGLELRNVGDLADALA